METVDSDILRMNIFRELMNLKDDKLEQVSNYIKSLAIQDEGMEYDMPEDVIKSAVDYTLEMIGREETLYTTEEVFERVDRSLGWK